MVDNASNSGRVTSDTRPIPDPTTLTEKAIESAIRAALDKIETRLTAMDKALDLLQRALDKSPSIAEVAQSVKSLKELTDTKFTDRDLALIAALAAAKEAVGAQNTSNSIAIAKSESSTAESLRQLQTIFQTAMTASTTQINDLKSRFDKGEGHSKGMGDGWGWLVGAVGIIIGIVTVIELILKR